jgi:hypothetical protein
MTKTPLTDLLQKYLTVIEKVALSKTLDTGYDTSNYTKAWTQAGTDAEKFLGLDAFKKQYGGTANEIEGSGLSLRQPAMKKLSTQLANALFGAKGNNSVREKYVDLLQVTQKNVIVPEGTSHSYRWLTPVEWAASVHGKLLTESNPIQVSHALKDFWKLDKNSNAISVLQTPRFSDDYFFTPVPGTKMETFIHSGNDAFPRPLTQASGKLQEYAAVNFQPFVSQASDMVKAFVKDEENLYILEELKNLGLQDLPTVVYDAMLIGIADAANTGIHKKNTEIVPSSLNRVGYQALKPTQTVLAMLESLLSVFKKENEVFMTPELLNSLTQAMTEIETFPPTYDPNFIEKLKKSVQVKKFDVENFTKGTATMLYFSLSTLINQINRLYTTKPPQDSEAKLYFGELGWTPNREPELYNKLIKASLNYSVAPMVILRGTANPGGNEDIVFAIEPFVINFIGKNKEPELLPLKQVGIVTMVHNDISHQAQTTDAAGKTVVLKKDYIEKFFAVQEKTNSILNSLYGKDYWMQILETCYEGDNKFKSGVLFVGLAPLFWDKADGDKDIYISYKPEHAASNFSVDLPLYLITDDATPDILEELPITYTEHNAIGVYFRREVYAAEIAHMNLVKGQTLHLKDASNVGKLKEINLNTDGDLVKKRTNDIINNPENNFKTLKEIRTILLKDLYGDSTSSQQLLADKCKTVVKTIFNNVNTGFWSIGKDNLACYNPFEVGGPRARPRFDTNNTNDQVIREQRLAAISKIMTAQREKK